MSYKMSAGLLVTLGLAVGRVVLAQGSSYVPNVEQMPSFRVTLHGGGVVDFNAQALPSLPLVLFLHDPADVFTAYMLSDNESVDDFLELDVNATFIFLPMYEAGDTLAIRDRLYSRLQGVAPEKAALWKTNLHFSNETLMSMVAKGEALPLPSVFEVST